MSASDLEKVLSLAAVGGFAEDEGITCVRAAARDLDELAVLLAGAGADDGEGDDDEDDDSDSDDDEDDDNPKAKGKKGAKGKGGKKPPPWLGKKKVKATALIDDIRLQLSRLVGEPVELTPEDDRSVVLRLAGKAPCAPLAPMSHGQVNGSHSHPHRVVKVVDGEHYHNQDSRHEGDGY